MKLVALVKPPADQASAVQLLVQAAEMTAAEARMRLAPEPPALLARLPPEAADALVQKLRAAKLAALAVGEVPADSDRLVARTLEFGATALELTSRGGESLSLPWAEVRAVLRGASASRSQSEHTERSRQVSLGAALVTGGLKMTKTTERTVRTTQEDSEQVIFVYGRNGESAVLRETVVDFACLGPLMQPARTANMNQLAQKLRQLAPGAFHDDRLLRIGRRPLPFVVGAEVFMASRDATTSRSSTAGGLDILAEVMRQALTLGLLP